MKPMNRRKAISYISKAIAGSAGVVLLGLKVNAQKKVPQKRKKVQRPKNISGVKRNRVLMRKTFDEELRDIKILVENSRPVFVNEYGRLTPIVTRPTTDFFPDGNIPDGLGNDLSSCFSNFNMGFEQGLWTCTNVNVCNGQGMDGWPGPGEEDSGCETKNTCNGQTCDKLYTCRNNKCRDQSCPQLTDCDKNKQKIVPSCAADLLDKFKTDPYVELLFQEFNVMTSAELVNMLEIKVDAIVQEVR
ncbi:MAG: hypothetical protein HN778_03530 [Prolixibacteraceae bacterium]|jgi:hypothetical protein|nr:hypothetical protein [Prolixibacteraceae bacterium]MBT6765588.1 hypothetical protein [Prolixibacteraceae bacterium]MBT6998936.1 hypothetical protein [Prolixibacteraceae bacterium]MBT7393885.1 hypothetical protein [Prolixibacteraceae bacterium]